MGRKVCFLGMARRNDAPPDIPDDVEIWSANEAYVVLPEGRKPDVIFQMHPRNWREDERRYLNHGALPGHLDPDCFGRDAEHVEYLRRFRGPVYGQQQWPDIPDSIEYPWLDVTHTVGVPLPPSGKKRLWATSTWGYMAAFLLTEHEEAAIRWGKARGEGIVYPDLEVYDEQRISELHLVGIELPTGSSREQRWEWPNFAYYLGLATGLGIKIVLPDDGTTLLSGPHYALDGRPWPQDADHWHYPGYAGIVQDGGVLRLGTLLYRD